MKRYLFIPLFLCIFSLSALYSYSVYANLSENLIRLHIIANSDSATDQAVKLAVRDEIIVSTNDMPDVEDINTIAKNVLKNYNMPYGAVTTFEDSFIPEKEYKNIRLPEGEYTCIKVILGDGGGKNWWCIAYPPLCFCEEVFGEMTDASMALLENRLSAESFRTIVKNGDVNLRFRLVEEFQKLRTQISAN